MRPTINITATVLAIVASLAAGDSGLFSSSKTTKTSKSKSSGCSCSLDTIERAQALTNVAYGMFGSLDGEANLDTLDTFCNEPVRQQVFMDAASAIAGCLTYPTCYVEIVFERLAGENAIMSTLPEGDFLALAIYSMCKAEETGVTQPEGGCGETTVPEICVSYGFPVGPN